MTIVQHIMAIGVGIVVSARHVSVTSSYAHQSFVAIFDDFEKSSAKISNLEERRVEGEREEWGGLKCSTMGKIATS